MIYVTDVLHEIREFIRLWKLSGQAANQVLGPVGSKR